MISTIRRLEESGQDEFYILLEGGYRWTWLSESPKRRAPTGGNVSASLRREVHAFDFGGC
jgi:hypothetical protein